MKNKSFDKKIRKFFTPQHDQTDCGVACLLTLIKYYGGTTSLERLRELSGTNKQGTTLLGLYQAALKVGFETEGCEADIPALIEHGQPVILHVLLENNMEHYVVCFGYENKRFLISDPAKGICYYTKDELEQIWKSHSCLTLSPSNKFVKEEEISVARKRWLLHLIHKDYGILGVSILIGLVIAMLSMTTAIFSQRLIDEIIPNREFKQLWIGVVLVFLLLLVRLGLSMLRQYLLYTQCKNFNNRIISFFYNKLLRLPKSFFDTRKTGDLVARLNDTRRIQQVISNIAGDFIINTLSAIVTLGILFYYSWTIATAFLCFIPIFIYIVHHYNTRIIDAQREVMVWYAHSESNFINTMQGIDTIKSFNKQTLFGNLNRSIYNIFQDRTLSLGKIDIRLSWISGFISIILITLSIAYGSYLVLLEHLKLGELMAIISLIASIMPSIVSLALIAIPINEAKVAFNRMFEFVSIEPEKEKGTKVKKIISSINIQDVSFRFAGHKRILNNLSLSLNKGEFNFVIGESGCGKTTLCHLLEKFYSPETGKIIINNEYDLENIAINDWRKHVGVMPQDIYIFNGTVLDNICLGVEQQDAQTIVDTCSGYGLDKYINQLPQGYATIIGENGINLSGGQKQLIALARLLIANPQVMILDEPTSAMDREMEKFTLETLAAIKKEKIIIMVSHRLHIIKRYADKIYLIEKNTLYHSGTHNDMLQSNNLYSLYLKEYAMAY